MEILEWAEKFLKDDDTTFKVHVFSGDRPIAKNEESAGDIPEACKHASIRIKLIYEDRSSSSETKLEVEFKKKCERGQLDTFTIRQEAKEFSAVDRIEIISGPDNPEIQFNWMIDTIRVENENAEPKVFSVFQRIPWKCHKTFFSDDTSLPAGATETDERYVTNGDGTPLDDKRVKELLRKSVALRKEINDIPSAYRPQKLHIREFAAKLESKLPDESAKHRAHTWSKEDISKRTSIQEVLFLQEHADVRFREGSVAIAIRAKGFDALVEILHFAVHEGEASDLSLRFCKDLCDAIAAIVKVWIGEESPVWMLRSEALQKIREQDLAAQREKYQLEVKVAGLPPQCKKMPEDEQFSFSYCSLTLGVPLILTSAAKFYETVAQPAPKNIAELSQLFDWVLPAPNDIHRWETDEAFGAQRLAGVNNTSIRLCNQIPDKLGITPIKILTYLQGKSLDDALKEKRLFIVDHDILGDCPTSEGSIVCAPIALFYQRNDGQLVPIAIQLFQAHGNPVFYPNDSPSTWNIAKLWFNNADAQIHQSVIHLGFTHLIMEGIVVITHRQLPPAHPLFKLLAPHFLYLIAINSAAVGTLLSKGGYIDSEMSVGLEGCIELIKRRRQTWRMDVEGTLPEDLTNRGVADPNILPRYYYREDGLKLYNAIRSYVSAYVNLYYKTDQVVENDKELQSWRIEMVRPVDQKGLGLQSVPGQGAFTNKDQIVLVLTSIIYTCSVGHAAANFKQYDEYAYPLNYPAKLQGEPPIDRTELTEAHVFETLPTRESILETMKMTNILSNRGTKPLGHFEVNYIFESKAVAEVEYFKANLLVLGRRMEEDIRDPPYDYLYPGNVPNSISI